MSDISKTCGRLGDKAVNVVLPVPVSDLAGYWLELTCCSGMTLFPINLIVQRQGGHHRLKDVLSRLRCQRCKGQPVTAYLNETHNRTFNYGAPPGWSVQLIPTTGEAAI